MGQATSLHTAACHLHGLTSTATQYSNMNQSFVLLTFALLVSATLGQDAQAACDGTCAVPCGTAAALCVDLPPFVDCAMLGATFSATCTSLGMSNAPCLQACVAEGTECDEQNKLSFNDVICKSKAAACEISCPLKRGAAQTVAVGKQLAGQAFAALPGLLGQLYGRK